MVVVKNGFGKSKIIRLWGIKFKNQVVTEGLEEVMVKTKKFGHQ